MQQFHLDFLKFSDHIYLAGIKIEFSSNDTALSFREALNESPSYHTGSKISKFVQRQLSLFADYTLKSTLFNVLTQGKLHVLAHELGHAMAYRLLSEENTLPTIIIYKNCTGETKYFGNYCLLNKTKKSVVDAAGAITSLLFSNLKILLAYTLKDTAAAPISYALAFGSIFWITGEVYYAYSAVQNAIPADYGCISMRSKKHLIIATSFLICGLALSCFITMKIMI